MMLRLLDRVHRDMGQKFGFCFTAFVAALLLSVTVVAQERASDSATITKPVEKQRLVVMGASASDGFGLGVRLSDALTARLDEKRITVENVSSSSFFFSPEREARRQIAEAIATKPTAIIGVDFLFWFAYGHLKDQDRAALLEKGLMLLEPVELPLILAELPDMSEAIGIMLRKQQVPSKETLEKLNVRIREWAKDKKHITLVPLGQLLDRMRRGEDLQMEGLPWKSGALPSMLQRDKLHPTLEGVFVMGELSLGALRGYKGLLDESALIPESTVALDRLKAVESARGRAASAEPVPGGK